MFFSKQIIFSQLRKIVTSSNYQSGRKFGQPVAQTHPHLLNENEVTPGTTKDEYKLRRESYLNKCSELNIFNETDTTHVALIPSSTICYMAPDVPYPFRQNSDLLYLTGFQEPDSALLLYKKPDKEVTSVLFVPKRDKFIELWQGLRTGSERAVDLTGVHESYNMDTFDNNLKTLFKPLNNIILYYESIKQDNKEFDKKYIAPLLKNSKIKKVISSKKPLHSLRVIKSQSEIKLMKESCLIGSKCLNNVINYSEPGIDEAFLYAKIDFECRINGAERLAYPPVVAGGNRANTIHYLNNNQIIKNGEMVLMDAGCEYHGYCSDITRTWPVNGRFSELQRCLYEAVLEVQEACITMCQPNQLSMNQIHHIMIALIGKQLQRLGIAPNSCDKKKLSMIAGKFCPHHVSHYLGMDVHDVDEMERNSPLKPGMIITIEPGIYIPYDMEEAPKQWRGMGIRIEDDILITSDQPYNLTATCVKNPDELEKLVGSSN